MVELLTILDAQALRELTPESESKLYEHALVLPAGAWHELKSQKDSVVYFNRTTKNGKPTQRARVASRVDDYSDAYGSDILGGNGGRLVGVVSTGGASVAAGKALEERVF